MTPIEVLERLNTLPPHLQPHQRRFYVEAVTEETKAPFLAYQERRDRAQEAAYEMMKSFGAVGFYPPHLNTRQFGESDEAAAVQVFAFEDKGDYGPAWKSAGRGYDVRRGMVALRPSKKEAGKKLLETLEAMPRFPHHSVAMDHFDRITDIRYGGTSSGVGYSDGAFHYTVPYLVGDRFFISGVNHNYDIAQIAQSAIDYPEYAKDDYEFKDDPISWRPGPGWEFRTKSEVDLAIAQARVAAEKIDA